MKKNLLIFVLISAAVILAGCRTPNEVHYPRNIRNVHIPLFRNNTLKYGFEETITNEVLSRFLADGRVNITTRDNADGILYGTIIQYVNQPLQYNENDEVLQYRLRIYVKLEYFDKGQNRILWTEESIDRFTSYSELVAPVETEREARERVASLLANDIFTRVVEGWINIVR